MSLLDMYMGWGFEEVTTLHIIDIFLSEFTCLEALSALLSTIALSKHRLKFYWSARRRGGGVADDAEAAHGPCPQRH